MEAFYKVNAGFDIGVRKVAFGDKATDYIRRAESDLTVGPLSPD